MKTLRFTTALLLSGIAALVPGAVAQERPGGATVTNTSLPASTNISRPVVAKVGSSPAVDLAGLSLGHIEDIVLSPTGCAQAVILTTSDGRLIPVPWTFVRATGDTTAGGGSMPGGRFRFTLTVDQLKLREAPAFARDQWPDMSNSAWLQKSAGFFGVAADEAVGGSGTGANIIRGGATGQPERDK
jgi:hypothetical protein